MLTNISLENFKGFQKLSGFNIKPITVLCGGNSSGKSSILQSILLLKQTLESRNLNQTLLLNGRFVHLGAFENIIYQKNNDNKVAFELSAQISRKDLRSERRSGVVPPNVILRDILIQSLFDNKEAVHNFFFKVVLKVSKEKIASYRKPVAIDSFHFRIETKTLDGNIFPGVSISANHHEGDVYSLEWKDLMPPPFGIRKTEGVKLLTGSAKASIRFVNLLPVEFGGVESMDTKPPDEVFMVLSRIGYLCRYILNSFTYLGPLREDPARRYIYEDEVVEIGNKGENAAYIFLSEKESKKIKNYFFDNITNSFVKEDPVTLGEAVKCWFDCMNIKGFDVESSSEVMHLNLNSNTSSETRVNIADVGFGVSQIFPVVLEGLRMPLRSTLLLEQPEIHLHPNLQMQMADYFISLALADKNVIVETHSDHIINRLVRRIVEDQDNRLKDLIGIYFVKADGSQVALEEVAIDETRGIVNWPDDFFDQTATEQEKILQAGLRKRQHNKAE